MSLHELLDNSFGELKAHLQDPTINEIMLNPDGHVWLDKFGAGRIRAELVLNPKDGEQIIRVIAGLANKTVSKELPHLACEVPFSGERFQGLLPPIVKSPSFTIRKPPNQIYTLNDYLKDKVITEQQRQIICDAVQNRANILIAGGTSSGKTTLTNAVLDEIAKQNDRLFIIEDTKELQCNAKDAVSVTTSPFCDIRDLVRISLRMRPDRIVVGEVRGGEALDLLKAWNTGHPGGVATIHANSAQESLSRLQDLLAEVVATPLPHLIEQAIDVVIFICRNGGKPRVNEILKLKEQS